MRELPDGAATRKARGAFFTPPTIAEFLARWAIDDDARATVFDPTCGEGVFLLAAAEHLRQLGVDPIAMRRQLTGADLHEPSLKEARALLKEKAVDAQLEHADFFDLPTPAQLGSVIGWQDAVVGNPPFVRYQEHRGDVRRRSAAAALAQGVRLSGLASSWAATLVHASAFLKPTGRLAMVLPAELLTVHYAEPVRRWLRERFARVKLVLFERLQFRGAEEQIVLLQAAGQGPCDSFRLFYAQDAVDLQRLQSLDAFGVSAAQDGKWTDLMLPLDVRRLFQSVAYSQMVRLDAYGNPELGTVTGANDYFAISEATRRRYEIAEGDLKPISPPGTKHLKGLTFTRTQWEGLKTAGDRVWLLYPRDGRLGTGLRRYVREGEERGVHKAYKCRVRRPWWRPPAVPGPDLFFTYMSHRYPRLVSNTSRATIVNSMHGIRLAPAVSKAARHALPLLALNSATMLGAEIHGRCGGRRNLRWRRRQRHRCHRL